MSWHFELDSLQMCVCVCVCDGLMSQIKLFAGNWGCVTAPTIAMDLIKTGSEFTNSTRDQDLRESGYQGEMRGSRKNEASYINDAN